MQIIRVLVSQTTGTIARFLHSLEVSPMLHVRRFLVGELLELTF